MVCSFAKFLALGLIAADGASASAALAEAQAAYADIAGKQPIKTGANAWTEAEVYKQTCLELDLIRKQLTTTPFTTNGTSVIVNSTTKLVTGCDKTGSAALQTKVFDLLKEDYTAYSFSTTLSVSGANDAAKIASVHTSLMTQLKQRFNAVKVVGSSVSFSETGNTSKEKRTSAKASLYNLRKEAYESIAGVAAAALKTSLPYTPQIQQLKMAISGVPAQLDSAWKDAKEAAVRAKVTAEKALQNNSNPALRTKAQAIQEAAVAYETMATPTTKASADQKLDKAKKLETDAADVLAAVEKERAEAVGGFFAVLAGLAIAFVALLFSPCFQYDFKNHAFDWETDNYERPEYYNGLDGTARDWRNKVNKDLGLPEEKEPSPVSAGKVDSAKASSSALTLVPVVILAGGVFAVARRGLNKRRAQKKAKRASRAQVKLHEDL